MILYNYMQQCRNGEAIEISVHVSRFSRRTTKFTVDNSGIGIFLSTSSNQVGPLENLPF